MISTGRDFQVIESLGSPGNFVVETDTFVLYSCTPFREGCSSPTVASQGVQKIGLEI